ncbi:MAG TPA: mechanosensitive ion channel family protein [Gemmatimonadaceae bacterium]|nr:mechanosensitive ion channel family protein [Gemmatimonadaceae bacterium]
MHLVSTPFWGNTPARWLGALAILVAGIALLYVVKRVVVARLARYADATKTSFDDFAVDVLRRTRFFFVFFLALNAASHYLSVDADVRGWVRALTVLAVALQALIWGSGLVTFAIERYSRRHAAGENGSSATTVAALSYLGRFLLFLVILLVALDNLGVNITALVTGLGVSGIALALAVQNILGDLFGALSIVLDKPFVVGDAIKVDQLEGTVEHIGLKTTRVRASSGEQIVFSNADLLRSRIRNFKRMVERRVAFTVGVAYETPPETVARIPSFIADIVRAQPQIRFDRSHLARLGDAALEFETVYYVTTSDYLLYMNTQQTINLAIIRRFRDEGIQFAMPGRNLVVVRGDGAASGGSGGVSNAVAATVAAATDDA